MFCGCSADISEAPPELPDLPGLPRTPWRAARSTGGRGARPGHRRGHRRDDARCARWDRKNYFYPDLPEGLPDRQFDLPLAADGGSPSRRPRARSRSDPGGHLEEDTASSSTPARCDRPPGRARRLQPLRRCRSWRSSPSRSSAAPSRPDATRRSSARCSSPARQRRRHGARGRCASRPNVSLRPPGPRGVRDAGRGQEHELLPLGRAGDRLRDRAPGARPRRRRDDSQVTPRLGRRARRDLRHALQGGLATTTATSRSRTCRRCGPTRPGWRPSRPACRSCRRRGAPVTASPGLTPYDASVLVADAGASDVFEAAVAAEPGLPPRSRRDSVTGDFCRLARAGPDAEEGPALRVDGAELGRPRAPGRASSRRRTPSRSSSATPRPANPWSRSSATSACGRSTTATR